MITASGRALLVGAAAALIVGIALGVMPLVVVGIVLAGAVIVARLLVRGTGDIEFERSLDRDRVTRGETALAELRVRNNSRRRIASSRALEPAGTETIVVPIPALDAGSGRTVRYTLPTDRRCVLPIGPLRIERSDPFILVRHVRGVGDARVLFVHPRRYGLARLPSTLLRSLDGPTSERAPRGSVVFHAIREYVPGDDRRYIHWRSSAKTGELKVRQFVDTSKPDVTVVLDDAASRHSEASFEECIEVVASLMVATVDAGFPTRLVTAGGVSIEPSGPHPTQGLLDRLAGLEPALVASLDHVLEALSATGNTLLVVSRDLTNHQAALIAARRGRFHSILVALVDPEGVGTVEAAPTGARLTRAATARDVVAEWNVTVR